MKRFLAVVGLLTIVTTPAFAQAYCECWGTGNVIGLAFEQRAGRADANSAFAQVPQKHKRRSGHKVGVDP